MRSSSTALLLLTLAVALPALTAGVGCGGFDRTDVEQASWYGRVDTPGAWHPIARQAFVADEPDTWFYLLARDVRRQFAYGAILRQWFEIRDRLGQDLRSARVVSLVYLDAAPEWSTYRAYAEAYARADAPAEEGADADAPTETDADADADAPPPVATLDLWRLPDPAPDGGVPAARLVLAYPHPQGGEVFESFLLRLELAAELGDRFPQWRLHFPYGPYQDNAVWVRPPRRR